jgi:hypothetical protein
MSFREKSAWACALTTLVVFSPYFYYILYLNAHERLNGGSVLWAFIVVVMIQAAMNIAAHIIFGIQTRREPKDERDLTIEFRSFRNAYLVLACSALMLMMGVLVTATGIPGDAVAKAVAVSQIFFSAFVLAEVVKYLTQAISYRRGG